MAISGRSVVGMIVIAFALLTACGKGNPPAAGSTTRSVPGAGGLHPKRPSNDKRRLPASTCVKGAASRGAVSNAIKFVVLCRAKPHGGTVGFAISRGGIHGFSRHLTMTGPGAGSKFGLCRKLHNRPIECQAHIHGRARITGTLWVDKRTRCTTPLSITVNETVGCSGGVCPTDLLTRQIFSGIPRGC